MPWNDRRDSGNGWGRDRDSSWDRNRRSRNGSDRVWRVEVRDSRDLNNVEIFMVTSEDDYERMISDVSSKQRWNGTNRSKFKLGDDPEAVEVVADVDGNGCLIATPAGSLNPRY